MMGEQQASSFTIEYILYLSWWWHMLYKMLYDYELLIHLHYWYFSCCYHLNVMLCCINLSQVKTFACRLFIIHVICSICSSTHTKLPLCPVSFCIGKPSAPLWGLVVYLMEQTISEVHLCLAPYSVIQEYGKHILFIRSEHLPLICRQQTQ